MTKTALVIGATGGIGGTVAAGLLARGWRVRALHRRAADVATHYPRLQHPDLTWVGGDAMVAGDVLRAAQGVDLIMHGANPPGYRNWRQLALPMLDSTIAAARAQGALILFPGTVYNYGPEMIGLGAPAVPEDAPQQPRTVKGGIRVEMERRLHAATLSDTGGGGTARVLIVRAGDYFGPHAGNTWFAAHLSLGRIAPGGPRRLLNPGTPGVAHTWAYLPDLARGMLDLVDRAAALPAFARFHHAGHVLRDGQGMADAIADACAAVPGGRRPVIGRFPWPLVRLAAPVVPLFRELREMRYLWQQPLLLDNRALIARLGAEPHTPIGQAVTATLRSLGCLPLISRAPGS